MRATHRTVRPNKRDERYELCDLPDCVYLMENGKCEKTTVASCAGKNCRFLVTSKEIQTSKKRWRDRLSGMDESAQLSIAKKYYGGSMPWKADENKELRTGTD